MFARGYKITAPKRFEAFVEDVPISGVIVAPDYAAICKADLRYYTGTRDKRSMDLKFPMSLIHEASGRVLKDTTGRFETGQSVSLIPLAPYIGTEGLVCDCPACSNPSLGPNYCPRAQFASSSIDGFSREFFNMPQDRLLPLPKTLDAQTAAFIELISIACAAARAIAQNGTAGTKAAFSAKQSPRHGTGHCLVCPVLVSGDGVLGYIAANVLKHSGCDVTVLGVDEKKLAAFEGIRALHVREAHKLSGIGYALEFVGGRATADALNTAIDVLDPGGVLVNGGVPDDFVALNTRAMMEKGITLRGVTRSSREDFTQAVSLFESPEFTKAIQKLNLGVDYITNIKQYYQAFEDALHLNTLGKRLMRLVF